jgi:hypothetical protein
MSAIETIPKLQVKTTEGDAQGDFLAHGHTAIFIPRIAEISADVIRQTDHCAARTKPRWDPAVLGQLTNLQPAAIKPSSALGELLLAVRDQGLNIDADPQSTLSNPAHIQRFELATGVSDLEKRTSPGFGPVVAIAGLEGEFSLVVRDPEGNTLYDGFRPGIVAYLGERVLSHQIIAHDRGRVTGLILAGARAGEI